MTESTKQIESGDLIFDINKIRQKEWEYIYKKRNNSSKVEQNENMKKKLKKVDLDKENLTGICFSGGGIRSATFCLGAMQGFIKSQIFKVFDYLSTVSGGGYIGSCLSSLLAKDPETGVDEDNSPFVGLRKKEIEYKDADKTELSVRHQMHHLRTHGDYLIMRKKFLSRDVQRAVGAITSGIFHHLFLFLLLLIISVSVLHLTLTTVVDNEFTDVGYMSNNINNQKYSIDESVPITDQLTDWARHCTTVIGDMFYYKGITNSQTNWMFLIFFIAGFVWTAGWVLFGKSRAETISKQIESNPPINTKSGFNIEEHYESRFITKFNWLSCAIVILLIFYFAAMNNFHYTALLLMPIAFAIGGKAAAYIMIHLRKSALTEGKRIYRSLFSGIQGATSYGLTLSILLPVIIVVFFSMHGLSGSFWLSLISFIVSYVITRGKFEKTGFFSKLMKKIQKPLLNFVVILFIYFSFLIISIVFFNVYNEMYNNNSLNAVIFFTSALIVFTILGFIVNANRISPHYFYRDRLTEAYLKTDARIKRSSDCERQGMPLKTLRNDESLELTQLGEGNNSGPYHILVTALNLQGSDELNRKSMLSEHFIFSKEYIGSKITGYIPTNQYRGGNTKLARAMTISGAAASSAMGKFSFLAQAFVMTLCNLRLGYWMKNPWYYCSEQGNHEKKNYFWPKYLWLELFGRATARQKLVNLSDGGHTGDNLGLFPLLQRRCKLIVICDAEADGEYNFQSFNTAVRMANIEENIDIRINLENLIPEKGGEKLINKSKTSVAFGSIVYPETNKQKGGKGTLVYLKSSISEIETKVEKDRIPVHIVNYARNYPDFPHQTTADQFFGDAQFEAYRALGEHVALQAAPEIKKNQVFKKLTL